MSAAGRIVGTTVSNKPAANVVVADMPSTKNLMISDG